MPAASPDYLSIALKVAGWAAKLLPWGKVMPTWAAKFGVLSFNIDWHRKDFKDGDGNVAYTMTQVLISNATKIDFHDARCDIVWKRKGSGQFEGQMVYGLWCKKVASGLASYPNGVAEKIDLPSNADQQHLGLAVTNPFGEAFMVCTAS